MAHFRFLSVKEIIMVSIIDHMVICGTVLMLALMILLSMPKSMMRSVLMEVLGWVGAVLAGIYVVSPIDAIPDFIPVVGWFDDGGALIAGIASGVMAMIGRSDRKKLQEG
jgi:uncharacterized membrane protein YkvA (DUF1232 family)